MTMVLDPCTTLERKISIRLRDDESHRRLSDVVGEVAVGAIHPARPLGLGRSDSGGMLEDAIASAVHAAVETLITHLEDLVETLPHETVKKLADEQLAAEHGIE
jgi:hypothetical protein